MTSDIPVPTEKDYLDASRAYLSADGRNLSGHTVGELTPIYARHADFRAAVDSAYAAGWRARDARVRKALPMCSNGEVVMVTDMAAYLRGRP